VGIRAVFLVGKIQAHNYKPDKAREGAVVSIDVHALQCRCGGAYYKVIANLIEIENQVFNILIFLKKCK